MGEVRVLVCGGRDFVDYEQVGEVLDRIHAETPIFAIIHGNARGADTCADVWATRRKADGVRCWPFPAQWSKYGKAAGPRRNQTMLGMKPDLVVAFPGGSGTADMVRRAEAAGIPVLRPAPIAHKEQE